LSPLKYIALLLSREFGKPSNLSIPGLVGMERTKLHGLPSLLEILGGLLLSFLMVYL